MKELPGVREIKDKAGVTGLDLSPGKLSHSSGESVAGGI